MSSAESSNTDAYRYLVVDSGPIIRLTGMTTLWQKARHFYTVPAVLQEIRDAKARQHLEQLPFTLETREASPEGINAVVDFSRQTGDYSSLSSVDIQVLGLLYDLEVEASCGDISHVRTTPKRKVGLGKMKTLHDVITPEVQTRADDESKCSVEDPLVVEAPPTPALYSGDEKKIDTNDKLDTVSPSPKTWAKLVNPSASSLSTTSSHSNDTRSTADIPVFEPSLQPLVDQNEGGQFSDAEDSSGDEVTGKFSCSHEECDVSIRDPEEVSNRPSVENIESECDFPSLSASLAVPYEDSDGDDDTGAGLKPELSAVELEREEQDRKLMSLKPISKSGKQYNSFTKYRSLMKAKPKKRVSTAPTTKEESNTVSLEISVDVKDTRSHIIGGPAFAGQGDDVDDDGEGWIVSSSEISSMKAAGALDPSRNPTNFDQSLKPNRSGPPPNQRAACTTTDFAMQNVILQMNLELLSVDGVKIRKLKNWVTRCGACFTVYTNNDNAGPLGKRLFCERCGSDMMQRIAASVDGKTGRLRLHLSKKYRHNLRGTKFSLPKPGTGNRFQGDLLLREDQLMMGAWNQKVKMRSGGKAHGAAQSIFGRDIASNVGCHTNTMNVDDIRVGFGRRNPNAAKGRERRGKKKKSSDKACGLRRY